jgi:ElaB/YqjD/DUF883 family membrane-anchored ribosome-binding protein
MGASADSVTEAVLIRREMARTRDEMGRTLAQLEDKLSPEVLKQRAKDAAYELRDQAKDAAYEATVGKVQHMVHNAGNVMKDTGSNLLDSVKANPIPLALAAVGIGWFVFGAVKTDKTDRVKAQATELVGDAEERVREVALRAQERGRDLEGAVQRTFQDNPLAIGLGVVAVGLAIGLAIPITHKEDEWLGQARDTLTDKAQQVAREAIGKVEERAKTMTNEAQNNGVTPAPGV